MKITIQRGDTTITIESDDDKPIDLSPYLPPVAPMAPKPMPMDVGRPWGESPGTPGTIRWTNPWEPAPWWLYQPTCTSTHITTTSGSGVHVYGHTVNPDAQ